MSMQHCKCTTIDALWSYNSWLLHKFSAECGCWYLLRCSMSYSYLIEQSCHFDMHSLIDSISDMQFHFNMHRWTQPNRFICSTPASRVVFKINNSTNLMVVLSTAWQEHSRLLNSDWTVSSQWHLAFEGLPSWMLHAAGWSMELEAKLAVQSLQLLEQASARIAYWQMSYEICYLCKIALANMLTNC